MKKYHKLLNYLQELNSLAIAFSGGVDSTFLIAAAKEALGSNVLAFTIKTPYIPDWELAEAKQLTKDLGVKHVILDFSIAKSIENNPENRCYLCKKLLFTQLKEETKKRGINWLADGTNADDLQDYRPGLKALEEIEVISPLLENGFTKEDIRAHSKNLHLPTWDKPAYACLLTRIPHNTKIEHKMLTRIEKAETYLINLGFRAVRVRDHGELARIEINPENQHSLLDRKDDISSHLQALGYKHVTMDLQGYRMGSFNKFT